MFKKNKMNIKFENKNKTQKRSPQMSQNKSQTGKYPEYYRNIYLITPH